MLSQETELSEANMSATTAKLPSNLQSIYLKLKQKTDCLDLWLIQNGKKWRWTKQSLSSKIGVQSSWTPCLYQPFYHQEDCYLRIYF